MASSAPLPKLIDESFAQNCLPFSIHDMRTVARLCSSQTCRSDSLCTLQGMLCALVTNGAWRAELNNARNEATLIDATHSLSHRRMAALIEVRKFEDLDNLMRSLILNDTTASRAKQVMSIEGMLQVMAERRDRQNRLADDDGNYRSVHGESNYVRTRVSLDNAPMPTQTQESASRPTKQGRPGNYVDNRASWRSKWLCFCYHEMPGK